MNAEQLNAIKERAEKATPGPWRSGGLYSVYTSEDMSIPLRPSDAGFIANARQDIPSLLAEVERLRKAIIAIEGEVYNDGSMTEIAWIVKEALTHDA